MPSKNSLHWLNETARAIIFFIATLLVLLSIRLFFFLFYRADQSLSTEIPALWLGLRLDARWFAILLAPAWLLWLLGLWKSAFLKIARWWAVISLAVFTLLGLVNFGFYGFYMTPISSLIFGFAQDDTLAIIVTLWHDWPIFSYLLCWLFLTLVPCIVWRCFHLQISHFKHLRLATSFVAIFLSLFICLICRGSLGTFPLRHQDLIVGPDPFVNATIPNGVSALVEANKSRKMLELKGGTLAGLQSFGFSSPQEAEALLRTIRTQQPSVTAKPKHPHVVIALMEGMGRTEFEIDSPENNMLGHLRAELQDAYVFKNGVSSTSGTFPSLESLIFDTPYTPLTQSQYGTKTFPFSNVSDFKKAGYTTIFLTSGSEKWRSIDTNFPRQGFDRIIGAGQIKAKFPEAEVSTWGLGDEWTFKYAEELLIEADQHNEKLLIVLLSVTNHPPHHVPDGVKVDQINVNSLPSFVKDDRHGNEPPLMLQTYQYAASALGKFIHGLRTHDLLEKVAIAATGDHNTRFKFDSSAVWYCQQAVPIIFWLPEKKFSAFCNATEWVGHRDIFPTMKAIALGIEPKIWQGRNLFSPHKTDGVYAFYGLGQDGFAIGENGAVALDKTQYRCFKTDKASINQTMSQTCSPSLTKLGDLARAQRALTDYVVRLGVLEGRTP